jgi:hypothetical protein
MTEQLSSFQQIGLDKALAGQNISFEATAGAGKSFLLGKIADNSPKKSLFVAFNVHNAEHLRGKINADCMTSHSLGKRSLNRFGAEYSPNTIRPLTKALGIPVKETLAFEQFWNVYRLTDSLPDSYECLSNIQDFCDEDISCYYEKAAIIEEIATQQFFESQKLDFISMLFLAARLDNIPKLPYEQVLIDESYDISPITLKLFKRLLKPSAQIIACGDYYQNLYKSLNMTHTDNGEVIREWWNCESLPLPISYRCPEAVVSEANSFVPSMQPFSAGGIVSRCSELPLDLPVGSIVLGAKYEDFIGEFISRRMEGQKVILKGHNFIEESLNTAKKIVKNGKSYQFPHLVMCAEDVINEKLKRLPFTLGGLEKKKHFTNVLRALSELGARFTTLEEAEKFASSTNKEQKPDIIFSTVHRAKGSESPHVYVMNYSELKRDAIQGDFERLKLAFVATTRSQENLTLVG